MVLWLARRQPFLRAFPAGTAVVLFLELVLVSALDTPGGDVITPALGVIVSAVASVALFRGLRRLPVASSR